MSVKRSRRRWLWIACFNFVLCGAAAAVANSRFDDLPLWSQVVLGVILWPGMMVLMLLNCWVSIDGYSILGRTVLVTASAATWLLVLVASGLLARLVAKPGGAF